MTPTEIIEQLEIFQASLEEKLASAPTREALVKIMFMMDDVSSLLNAVETEQRFKQIELFDEAMIAENAKKVFDSATALFHRETSDQALNKKKNELVLLFLNTLPEKEVLTPEPESEQDIKLDSENDTREPEEDEEDEEDEEEQEKEVLNATRQTATILDAPLTDDGTNLDGLITEFQLLIPLKNTTLSEHAKNLGLQAIKKDFKACRQSAELIYNELINEDMDTSRFISVLMRLDQVSEENSTPTHFMKEIQLREEVTNTLREVEILLEHVKTITGSDTHLFTAQTFAFQSELRHWQDIASRQQPTDDDNQKIVMAYQKLDSWFRNADAQRVIREHTWAESCFNQVISCANSLLKAMGSPTQYPKISRDNTVHNIQASMQSIDSLSKKQADPLEFTSEFEKTKHRVGIFLEKRVAHLKEEIGQAEKSKLLGIMGRQPAIRKARAQTELDKIKPFLNTCNLYIQNSAATLENSSDPDQFLNYTTGFAKAYYAQKERLPEGIASAMEFFLGACDTHAESLKKPTHIKVGRALEENLQKLIGRLDKKKIPLNHYCLDLVFSNRMTQIKLY